MTITRRKVFARMRRRRPRTRRSPSPITSISAPWLNPSWDSELAERRIEQLGRSKAAGRKLSGGQRAQLALTLAIAKRPELLILDEPVASLDPLVRREFLQHLMEAVAEHQLSVVLSSHLVADLERVCDYLIVLVASRAQVTGEVEGLLASHHRLTGARRDPPSPHLTAPTLRAGLPNPDLPGRSPSAGFGRIRVIGSRAV